MATQFAVDEQLLGLQADTSPASSGGVIFVQESQHPSFLLEVRNKIQITSELMARINTLLANGGLDVTITPTQGTKPAEDLTAEDQALARGEARLVGWTNDGTLVTGSVIENAWGLKRQAVDAARQRGEIFSVWVKGQHWYPQEALKFKRGDLAEINRSLGDSDPSSKLLFLLRKHGALGGKTAADAVQGGQFDDVLRLATEWARS